MQLTQGEMKRKEGVNLDPYLDPSLWIIMACVRTKDKKREGQWVGLRLF